jgi:hypothetical protein
MAIVSKEKSEEVGTKELEMPLLPLRPDFACCRDGDVEPDSRNVGTCYRTRISRKGSAGRKKGICEDFIVIDRAVAHN